MHSRARLAFLFVLTIYCLLAECLVEKNQEEKVCDSGCNNDFEEVFLIKVGGSSITVKGQHETLNQTALDWFGQTMASAVQKKRRKKYVVIHGAGSFGHYQAKQYGLTSQSQEPSLRQGNDEEKLKAMEGLAKTRLSVQTLNQHVVSNLIQHGVPAVGISPCLAIPTLQAHGGPKQALVYLGRVVHDLLEAGLVPVLHGDACLYGPDHAGILGGDLLMVSLVKSLLMMEDNGDHVENQDMNGNNSNNKIQAIFLTDVDGVYTSDPRLDPKATLLEQIEIDFKTKEIMANVVASESSHSHDVTGGLKGKLGAATDIVLLGTDALILKCKSSSAEQAIIHGTLRTVDRGSRITSSSS